MFEIEYVNHFDKNSNDYSCFYDYEKYKKCTFK